MSLPIPTDNQSYRFPVSVKGIVFRRQHVILLKNERDEWELPGGKLEPTESPKECVVREIEEELGLHVRPTAIVDSWLYTIAPGTCVLIVSYGCVEIGEAKAVLSHEHKALRWVPLEEVPHLHMPDGYKASIQRWQEQHGVA
jgi:8-oxo-dGTP pyrophosphatase MutT (NUDIX family)